MLSKPRQARLLVATRVGGIAVVENRWSPSALYKQQNRTMGEAKGQEGTWRCMGYLCGPLVTGPVLDLSTGVFSARHWDAVDAHIRTLDAELLEAIKTCCSSDMSEEAKREARRLFVMRCFFVDVNDEAIADDVDMNTLRTWRNYAFREALLRQLSQYEPHTLPSGRRLYQALERVGALQGAATHQDQAELCQTLMNADVTPLVVLVRAELGLPCLGRSVWRGLFSSIRTASVTDLQRHLMYPDVAAVLKAHMGSRGWITFEDYKPTCTLSGPMNVTVHREKAAAALRDALQQIRSATADNRQARGEYPVILLAGAPGIGKTHFIHCAGNILRDVGTHGSDDDASMHIIEVRLQFKETPQSGEDSLVTESIIATRIFQKCFVGGIPTTMLTKHFQVAQSLTLPFVLDLVATHLCPEGKTPAIVLSVDEAQNFKRQDGRSLLKDLMVDLGDAMRTAPFPVVCMVAGLTPQKMQDAVSASSHPSKILPLEWFGTDQRASFFKTIAKVDPWFPVAGASNATVEVALRKLADVPDTPLLNHLVSDTGGHPRMLVFLSEIIVRYLVRKPSTTKLGDLNAIKARRDLRMQLREKYGEHSTLAAVGGGFTSVELLRMIAVAVGNIAVRLDDELLKEEGRVAFTVEQLVSNGVFTSTVHPVIPEKVAIQIPFLLVQTWLESIRGELADFPESYRFAAGRFHWTMRQWIKQEVDMFSPSTSSSTLWEAIGAMYTCLRANALCVWRQTDAFDMSFSEFYQGALLSQALLNQHYMLHVVPMFFVRVCEKIQGDCRKLTEWGAEGSRDFELLDDKDPRKFQRVIINGEDGPGFDILSVRQVVRGKRAVLQQRDQRNVVLVGTQVVTNRDRASGVGAGAGAGAGAPGGEPTARNRESSDRVIELDQRKALRSTTALNWKDIANGIAAANLKVGRTIPIIVEIYSTSQMGCKLKDSQALQDKWDTVWEAHVSGRKKKWDRWVQYDKAADEWEEGSQKPDRPQFRRPASRIPWRKKLSLIMLVAGSACRTYFGPMMADRPMLRACKFPSSTI